MKHCCKNFEYYINRGIELQYSPVTRSYHMKLENNENLCTRQEIWYCPWCGTKLPKDLDGTWSRVLKEEYGIIDPNVTERDKVPEEFKTDEWWKKRGL